LRYALLSTLIIVALGSWYYYRAGVHLRHSEKTMKIAAQST
jgi:hypothetical protein